jgi:gamma-glutamylcysteine synthetase
VQDGASISLEPGGQFELSGAPFANVYETCDEVNRHLNEVRYLQHGMELLKGCNFGLVMTRGVITE